MKVEPDFTKEEHYISSISVVINGRLLCLLSVMSHVAEHVQQIRNKKTNAHLFLQQPASKPWVVLNELLIAQAVLHRSGYVAHPNGCCSALLHLSRVLRDYPAQAAASNIAN